MTARDTLPADPELLAARPPNPAATAQPGWRGTDPDGGTWVLAARATATYPWWYVSANGENYGWRSQEEAEAAGLVRLIPAVGYHYDERGEDVVPDDAAPAPIAPGARAVTDAERAGEAETFLAHWAGGNRVSAEDREDFIAAWTGWHRGADFDRECAERDAKAAIDAYVSALAVERAELTAALADARSAAPAPLDPGNPEHLRQVAEFVLEAMGTAYQPVVIDMHSKAARLEAAAAEAAQDVADRALATEKARAKNPAEWETLPEFDQNTIIDMVMTGIRAADERAGRARQEAGQ
ncbi:hypothetical protein [Tsukamurella tyrosinosolvens]|uniref:hypothetical protein n=1 Tax=Tsukamurella tyrosinosolvens TaxID=57704 RepID=UPI000DF70355|nr:hypothetical protein [Tsukamurella tyrosinosolvens]RDB46170.1 hypothetical protein DVB87_19555 [Tsukamurella tyrosinosolvens]